MKRPGRIDWSISRPPRERDLPAACERLREAGVALSADEPEWWLVGDPALAAEALGGHSFASSILGDGGVPIRCPVSGLDIRAEDTVLASDGERHARLRSVLVAALDGVGALPAALEALAAREIARLRPRGSCDLVRDFAVPACDWAAGEALGVPEPERAELGEEIEAMWEALLSPLPRAPRYAPLMARLVERLRRGMAGKRGALARIGEAVRAGRCTEPGGVSLAVSIVQGMSRTPVGLASAALRDLLARGDAPGPRAARGAVERALREHPPVRLLIRVSVEGARLGPFHPPPGTRLAVSLRALGTIPGARQWAFGHGPHACPAGRVGQAMAEALVAAMLSGLPGLRLDPAGEDERPEAIFSVPRALRLSWVGGRGTLERLRRDRPAPG